MYQRRQMRGPLGLRSWARWLPDGVGGEIWHQGGAAGRQRQGTPSTHCGRGPLDRRHPLSAIVPARPDCCCPPLRSCRTARSPPSTRSWPPAPPGPPPPTHSRPTGPPDHSPLSCRPARIAAVHTLLTRRHPRIAAVRRDRVGPDRRPPPQPTSTLSPVFVSAMSYYYPLAEAAMAGTQ